jgi:cytochrome c553
MRHCRWLPVLAAAALATAPLACSRGYEPGLGELMSLQQMRHDKLWRAAEANNWELASYELDELGEGFGDVVKYHPTHKDSPLSLSAIVPKIMGQPQKLVRAAIEAKNPQAFGEAYDTLTAACNSCHQATNFGFNVVRRPPDATWFGNQEFAPGR